jgi:hypothetical protein
MRGGEKNPYTCWDSNCSRPARSVVNILTELLNGVCSIGSFSACFHTFMKLTISSLHQNLQVHEASMFSRRSIFAPVPQALSVEIITNY